MATDHRAAQLSSLRIERTPEPQNGSRGPAWGTLGLGLLVGALAAGGVSYVWLGSPHKKPAAVTASKQSAPAATATPLGAGNLIASGYIVARHRATVAAEITGRVTAVLVEEGQRVKKGQLLATLDPILAAADVATTEAQVKSAEASVGSISADLADAIRIRDRVEELAPKGFASNADLTRTRARVESLQAQLRQAKAAIATSQSTASRARQLLGKYRIVAPFSGVVVDKNAQAGEIISPASAGGGFTRTGICTLVDMDSLEIEVDVNEAFIGRVFPDQSVKATLDAYPDWTIPAQVIAIVPTANREKATVRVRIALLAKDARILPDMAAKVSFAERDPPKQGT